MAELGRKSKSKRRHEKDPEWGGESRGEEGRELVASPGQPAARGRGKALGEIAFGGTFSVCAHRSSLSLVPFFPGPVQLLLSGPSFRILGRPRRVLNVP